MEFSSLMIFNIHLALTALKYVYPSTLLRQKFIKNKYSYTHYNSNEAHVQSIFIASTYIKLI